MKTLMKIVIAITFSGIASIANAQEANNLDDLLEIVRQGKVNETEEYRQRESAFRTAQDRQAGLLSEAQAEQAAEERRSDRLEAQFAANDDRLTELETEFTNELGALKEVLGVLQLVSGDTRSRLEGSLTSTQFEGREEFITTLIQKTASGTQLPSIEEIEPVIIPRIPMSTSRFFSMISTRARKIISPITKPIKITENHQPRFVFFSSSLFIPPLPKFKFNVWPHVSDQIAQS